MYACKCLTWNGSVRTAPHYWLTELGRTTAAPCKAQELAAKAVAFLGGGLEIPIVIASGREGNSPSREQPQANKRLWHGWICGKKRKILKYRPQITLYAGEQVGRKGRRVSFVAATSSACLSWW